MRTSENVGNVMRRIADAQAAMEPAINNQTNQHGKGYADLAATLSAVLRPLGAASVATAQWFERYDVNGGDGVRVWTRLSYGDEYVLVNVDVAVSDLRDMDALLSAVAIGRRYGLAMLTGVPSVDAPRVEQREGTMADAMDGKWGERWWEVEQHFKRYGLSAGQRRVIINGCDNADDAITTAKAIGSERDPIL